MSWRRKYIRKIFYVVKQCPVNPAPHLPSTQSYMHYRTEYRVFVPALSFAPFLLYRVSVQFQRIHDSNVRHDICELWLLFYCCWRDWEILFRNPLFAGAGLHSKQEKKAVETKEILVEAKIASHSQSSAQNFWSSFHLLSITQHKKVSLGSSGVLLHLSTTAAHAKPSRERTVLSSPQWDTQRLCLSDNAGRWKKCFQEFQESTYAKQK